MEKHGILRLSEIDNLDDRREIFYLLTLLSLEEQKKFLEHTVNAINAGVVFRSNPPHVLLEITQDCCDVRETYFDLMLAIAKYDIPVQALLDDLTRYASKLGKLTENQRRHALDLSVPDTLG